MTTRTRVLVLVLALMLTLATLAVGLFRAQPARAQWLYVQQSAGETLRVGMNRTNHADVGSIPRYAEVKAISSDGRWAIYQVARQQTKHIFRADVNGHAAQQLTTFAGKNEFQAFSPDGDWLIFSATFDGDSDLYKMRLDGSAVGALTDNTVNDYFGGFSPDGRAMIYQAGGTGDSQLHIVSLNGGDDMQLTQADGVERFRAWSRDGWVYYERSVAFPELWRIRHDGTQDQHIGRGNFHLLSPDEEWLIYGNNVLGGDRNLYRVRVDGAEVQQLTDAAGFDGVPMWSPDGDWLIFLSDRDGNRNLYRMRPDGGEAQAITTNPARDDKPTLSPDGRWLVFQTERDSTAAVYRVQLDGGNESRLAEGIFAAWGPIAQSTPTVGLWPLVLLGLAAVVLVQRVLGATPTRYKAR